MVDDSDCYVVGQPPAELVELAERFQAWTNGWTGGLVRLAYHLWWLRDICPLWPADAYAEQWAAVPPMLASLRQAVTEAGALFDDIDAAAAAGKG